MKNIRQEIMEEELVWNKIVEIYEYLAYQYSEMSQDKVYACSSVEQYKNLINKAKNYACQSKCCIYVCSPYKNVRIRDPFAELCLFKQDPCPSHVCPAFQNFIVFQY